MALAHGIGTGGLHARVSGASVYCHFAAETSIRLSRYAIDSLRMPGLPLMPKASSPEDAIVRNAVPILRRMHSQAQSPAAKASSFWSIHHIITAGRFVSMPHAMYHLRTGAARAPSRTESLVHAAHTFFTGAGEDGGGRGGDQRVRALLARPLRLLAPGLECGRASAQGPGQHSAGPDPRPAFEHGRELERHTPPIESNCVARPRTAAQLSALASVLASSYPSDSQPRPRLGRPVDWP